MQEGVAFRIDRILPDRLAVEYAEHVVGGLHRHARSIDPRVTPAMCGEVTRFVSLTRYSPATACMGVCYSGMCLVLTK